MAEPLQRSRQKDGNCVMSTIVDNKVASLTIKPLNLEWEQEYELFVDKHPAAMLCYSLKWLDVVAAVTGAEPLYSMCLADDKIVGVMPAFLQSSPQGNVLNALPFYGFHGEPLVDPEYPQAHRLLLDAFWEEAKHRRCRSATVISNPLMGEPEWALPYKSVCCHDKRIGQIVQLPEPNDDAALLHLFEGRTRTAIRKAVKEGLVWRTESDKQRLDDVFRLHVLNAAALGIPPKPAEFFKAVAERMVIGIDYDIYTASISGQPTKDIAHLLLFYYAHTVEYFTPCIVDEYRSRQPLSLLIFEAMKRAASAGYRYWNFGGTAAHQTGVYTFKKSWGAMDLPYHYQTRLYDASLRDSTTEELLKTYPYFYTIPFSELETR